MLRNFLKEELLFLIKTCQKYGCKHIIQQAKKV